MRNVVVKTKNVLSTLDLVESIRQRGSGVPGLGLVYSDPGLGKTETCTWLVGRKGSNAVYIRSKANITSRWLLEMIVGELGAAPLYRYADLYRQAVGLLMGRDTMLLVDEVDFCCHDSRVLESLRDLHDECGNPVVLIGMGQVDKKLMRHPHFFSRISQIYKFQPLDADDVATAARELCEVELTDEASISLFKASEGSFRAVKIILSHLEALARRNSLNRIEASHVNNLDWRAKK
jgi:DNA transposition AAA+ family ATPase